MQLMLLASMRRLFRARGVAPGAHACPFREVPQGASSFAGLRGPLAGAKWRPYLCRSCLLRRLDCCRSVPQEARAASASSGPYCRLRERQGMHFRCAWHFLYCTDVTWYCVRQGVQDPWHVLPCHLDGWWLAPKGYTSQCEPAACAHAFLVTLDSFTLSAKWLLMRCRLPIDRYGSPDPFRRSRPMSPEPNRPMSPDGLGGGLGSSVFMDAGVEGLLQPSPINLRQTRCVDLIDGQGVGASGSSTCGGAHRGKMFARLEVAPLAIWSWRADCWSTHAECILTWVLHPACILHRPCHCILR